MVDYVLTNEDIRPMDQEGEYLKINAVDHVHWWVGNAKQSMYYWWKAFGFRPVAYSGLETGNREFCSYVLESGKIRFVVSSSYKPNTEIAVHHLLHGDGVKYVSFAVDNVEQAYNATLARGAVGVWEPREEKDAYGIYRTAAIETYGETVHIFVDRSDYNGVFSPKYQPLDMESESVGLVAIDHIVGNVELGKMNHWVNFYHRIMGFRQLLHFDDNDISTEYSALMSKVMANGNGRIKLPINEPADGKRKSQIEEYLDYYMTPGVQHVAIACKDILATVRKLRENGIEFYVFRIPIMTFCQNESVKLKKTSIPFVSWAFWLIVMMRISIADFHETITRTSNCILEIIQRHGSRGFGIGNFKALFEAIDLNKMLVVIYKEFDCVLSSTR